MTITYPFVTYRYFLDDVELLGDPQLPGRPGQITLDKNVIFPEFDASKFYFVGKRNEHRTITLSFETWPNPAAPQLERLVISNDDNDGRYEVELRIEAVLPDGHTIPVGTDGITIGGQVIAIDDEVFERYRKCIAAYLNSLNIKVKPTLPEQWETPEIRWQHLDAAVQRLEALRELQLIAPSSVDAIRTQIATKLGF